MPLNPPLNQMPVYEVSEGTLYLVPTPIGNLSDITFRAIDVLRAVSLIAAEDTRNTARLLSAFEIRTPMISCHEHNEEKCAQAIVRRIGLGEPVALVTDAGTPAISDPGFRIVNAAIEHGIPVVPLPGASAAVCALSASGLPSDAFCFLGFAPKKRHRRKDMLQKLATRPETLIFYESPRRITPFLKEVFEIMGDRKVVVAREMTKLHEEFIRGRVSKVIRELERRETVKGEITLLVAGSGKKRAEMSEEVVNAISEVLEKGDMSHSDIAKFISEKYDMPKNRIYRIVMDIKHSRSGTD